MHNHVLSPKTSNDLLAWSNQLFLNSWGCILPTAPTNFLEPENPSIDGSKLNKVRRLAAFGAQKSWNMTHFRSKDHFWRS